MLIDFVTSSVTDTAKQFIQKYKIMTLNLRNQEIIVEALLNFLFLPEKVLTAQHYQQNIGTSSDSTLKEQLFKCLKSKMFYANRLILSIAIVV